MKIIPPENPDAPDAVVTIQVSAAHPLIVIELDTANGQMFSHHPNDLPLAAWMLGGIELQLRLQALGFSPSGGRQSGIVIPGPAALLSKLRGQ